MPFSERVKLKVKEKAAFRCCRCQHIGVDVHHIVPEEHGGSDDIDNAAPLCPSCHDHFGDNPKKRKEIKQMRDWWYGMVSKSPSRLGTETLKQIDEKLNSIVKNQADISELKVILKPIMDKYIGDMTAGTATATTSGIINVVSEVAKLRCPRCGELLPASAKFSCPSCGNIM